jgi:hypothetical protein
MLQTAALLPRRWSACWLACTLAISATWPGVAAFAQTSTPSPAPTGCHSQEHQHFDFWVGRWNVYSKAAPDTKIADSLIEALYDGCAIRENWKPLKGSGGGSLSAYRPGDRQWHQVWLDGQGSWVEFTGAWNGTSMVIEGLWPQPGHPGRRTRMTYTPLPDGSVEQRGESSDDNGTNWQPSFDFIYRRAAAALVHPELQVGTAATHAWGLDPSASTWPSAWRFTAA